jgi:hypothetical protein
MKWCECGCGEKTKGGEFLPGHDQRLRVEVERVAGGLLKLRELVEAAKDMKIICKRSIE